jgi:hypothetical protein
MTVLLFLNVLAADNFLDPLPPVRRSGGDFIGRAKPAGRKRPCNQPYNTMHVATQYLYCVAQNNPENAAPWPRCEEHQADR